MREPPDIDRLAYALGNETRRKILFILSQNEDYPFSLAAKLSISPRAVMQNLNILEETGLIEKSVKKSVQGPQRTYYRIKRGVQLNISLSPRCFRVKMSELPENLETNITEFKSELEELKNLTVFDAGDMLVKKSIELLTKTDNKLKELEDFQCMLLKLRDKIFEEIDKTFSKDGLEVSFASLIKSLLELGGEVDIFDLLDYHKVSKDKLDYILDLAKKYNLIKEKKVNEEKDYYTL